MVETDSKKEMPTGVKIISVLYYIAAGFAAIGALVLMIVGSSFMPNISGTLPIESFGVGVAIFFGIFLLAVAALDFFIARGLWNGKSWSRIMVLIFGFIGLVGSFISLAQADFSVILGLLIQGTIVGYLLFSKEVKEAFN